MMKKIFSDKVFVISSVMFSFLFSVAVILTPIIDYTDDLSQYFQKKTLFLFAVFFMSFVCSLIAIVVVKYITGLRVFKNFLRSQSKKLLNDGLFFLISFFMLFLGWSVCWLTFFPAILTSDGHMGIFYTLATSGQHPITYTMTTHLIYYAGKALFGGNVFIGFAMNIFLQIVLCDCAVSGCLLYFYRKKINLFLIILCLLYFAFLPIIGNYMTDIIKDTIFGVSVMLFSVILYETVDSQGKFLNRKYGIFLFTFVSLAVCLTRNNGKYVVLATFFMLFFFLKDIRRKTAILLVVVMVLSAVPNLLLKMFVDKENLKQEALAVPLHQVSEVICNDGITDEDDKAFLSQIMDLEIWKRDYNFQTIDSVKWNGNFNGMFFQENYRHFLKIWIKYLPKNIPSYLKAYFLATYGFWSVGTDSRNHKAFFHLAEYGHLQVFPDNIQNVLSEFYMDKAFAYPGSGTCFWISLFLILVLIINKRYSCVLAFLPSVFCWGTVMISSPMAYGFRYTFYYVLCLPFFVLMLMNEIKTVQKKTGLMEEADDCEVSII